MKFGEMLKGSGQAGPDRVPQGCGTRAYRDVFTAYPARPVRYLLGSMRRAGFTLIELLVVMSIIATLLSIAVPYYFNNVQKSKEAVLREDLAQMRDALDKYYGDAGRYPDVLDDLVAKKYIRRVPVDPVTGSDTTWVIVAPEDASKGGVYDVHSGAAGEGLDGTSYGEW